MLEFMCADAGVVGAFWSKVLDIPLDEGATSDYAQLSPPEPQAKWLFVKSEPSGSSDRMLVALTSDDLDGDAEHAVRLGATHEGRHERDGFEWVDLRDPEGNRFTFNAPRPGNDIRKRDDPGTRTIEIVTPPAAHDLG